MRRDLTWVDIGGGLREARVSANVTLEVAAAQVGMTPTQLSEVEEGVRPCAPSLVDDLASYYGVDVREVLDPELRSMAVGFRASKSVSVANEVRVAKRILINYLALQEICGTDADKL